MTRKSDLISASYVADNAALHEQGFGEKGGKWAFAVEDLARRLSATTVLDYGCGQGQLGAFLRRDAPYLEVAEYDPAIPDRAALPEPADLVVCTDVLEHVEPDRLDAVIGHLFELSRLALFCVISTKWSAKVLPISGRGAHLTVKPAEWWRVRVAPPVATFKLYEGRYIRPLKRPGGKPRAEVNLLFVRQGLAFDG